MWARHVEVMLGLWLAISGFVFAVPERETVVWTVDLLAAFAVSLLSLGCHHRRLARAHLGTGAVGVALFVFGYLQHRPLAGWHQNHVLVGLLLCMFAIVPTRAELPPRAWRRPA